MDSFAGAIGRSGSLTTPVHQANPFGVFHFQLSRTVLKFSENMLFSFPLRNAVGFCREPAGQAFRSVCKYFLSLRLERFSLVF